VGLLDPSLQVMARECMPDPKGEKRKSTNKKKRKKKTNLGRLSCIGQVPLFGRVFVFLCVCVCVCVRASLSLCVRVCLFLHDVVALARLRLRSRATDPTGATSQNCERTRASQIKSTRATYEKGTLKRPQQVATQPSCCRENPTVEKFLVATHAASNKDQRNRSHATQARHPKATRLWTARA
jgi:hypothetical protein